MGERLAWFRIALCFFCIFVSHRNHELSLSHCVAHELHGARVAAAREDEGVGALGSRDQTLLERLLLPPVHLEVLGSPDQGDREVRTVWSEEAPMLDQERLHQLNRSLVGESEVPVKKNTRVSSPFLNIVGIYLITLTV